MALCSLTDTFAYDLAGNRLSDTRTGVNAGSTVYVYDERDRLRKETTGGTSIAYTYDANGSELTKGADSYQWDLRGRMKSATVGGTSVTYTYDETGQRVGEVTGGSSTVYLNDRVNPSGYPQILEQQVTNNGANASTSFVLGLRPETQSDTTSGTVSLVRDGHGSVRDLLRTDVLRTRFLASPDGSSSHQKPRLPNKTQTFLVPPLPIPITIPGRIRSPNVNPGKETLHR